jgi:hypothetical protein
MVGSTSGDTVYNGAGESCFISVSSYLEAGAGTGAGVVLALGFTFPFQFSLVLASTFFSSTILEAVSTTLTLFSSFFSGTIISSSF